MSSADAALSLGRLFLVRESQRNPQGFVLSLCHLQKVKHYLILPVSTPPLPQSPRSLQWRHRTPTACRPALHSWSPLLGGGVPALSFLSARA